MSKTGSFIIRHEFVQAWTDKGAARTFVFKTIERLKEYFHLQEPDEYFKYEEDDYGDLPPSFELPLYHVTLYLYNDFWKVDHCYYYWDIVDKRNGDFWLRRNAFDIARALGEKEAWYASECFAAGDCVDDEWWDKDFTLALWLDCCKKHYDGVIPEFDRASFLLRDEEELCNNCQEVYHDDFKDLFEELKAGFGGYEIVGLTAFGGKYLQCEKDSKRFLVDRETLKPLFDEPIDCVVEYFGGCFVVKRNGLSALFDANGVQRTDFVKGRFEHQWKKDKLWFFNRKARVKVKC